MISLAGPVPLLASPVDDLMRQDQPAARVMEVLAQEETRQSSGKGKVGRSDSCPSGSGLKYKKCHGHTGLAAPRKGVNQPGHNIR